MPKVSRLFGPKRVLEPGDLRVTAGFSPFATVSVSASLAPKQRSSVAEDDVTWTSFVNTPVLVTSDDTYLIGLFSLANLAGMLLKHQEFATYGFLVLQLAFKVGNQDQIKEELAKRINTFFDKHPPSDVSLQRCLPATSETITDTGMPDEVRLRRWYKHVMEFSPTARFPIDSTKRTIQVWNGSSTTPDLPQKRILETVLTNDNAAWKRLLTGEFPVIKLAAGMPQGDDIPRGALWTASTTLRLIDPDLSKSTIARGSLLLVNRNRLLRSATTITVNDDVNAEVYYYFDDVVDPNLRTRPVDKGAVEHYFIGG